MDSGLDCKCRNSYIYIPREGLTVPSPIHVTYIFSNLLAMDSSFMVIMNMPTCTSNNLDLSLRRNPLAVPPRL